MSKEHESQAGCVRADNIYIIKLKMTLRTFQPLLGHPQCAVIIKFYDFKTLTSMYRIMYTILKFFIQ